MSQPTPGAEPDDAPPPAVADEPESRPWGLPLYVWVVIAVALAIPVGLGLGVDADAAKGLPPWALGALGGLVGALELVPDLIIRALKALAAPLVILAILTAIVTNDIRGRQGARMMLYYLVNTLLAMAFGLVLTNLIRPGEGANLGEGSPAASAAAGAPRRLIDVVAPRPPSPPRTIAQKGVADLFRDLVPENLIDAFLRNNLAQLVLFTVAIAVALAQVRNRQRARGETSYLVMVDLLGVGFEVLMKVLLWVIALVPLAVFGVVATSLGREGFELFLNLGWFILAVLAGLACQVTLYLCEIAALGRIGPVRFLRGAADVMATTFSTASTAATMPVTLRSLTGKLGLSRESSQLAACVGTNFNNDGTALYQAVAALFFAQALGAKLDLSAQLVIVITTLVASVGAGGIPSGSFVTMPLIFAAVNLPADKLPILLTIDWFLDRCRTTSNVLGDMTVAVLLERTAGKGDRPGG
jgi:DAACS family dicarboxylate/amino acid:cation (Na+ or H+) symporter